MLLYYKVDYKKSILFRGFDDVFMVPHSRHTEIKAEDIPHAFDRFYKARNEKNKSGSGLGLAIAKQIALRHDMTLDLESEQGKYTKITVNLPPKEKVE